MQWVALIIAILKIIRELKKAPNKETFLASQPVKEIGDGKIIEWIWENREEILAFIMKLIDMFTKKPVLFGSDESPEDILKDIAS